MEESNFAKKKEETQTQTQTPEQMREEEMAAIAAKENQQVSKDDTLKGSEPPKKWEAKKEIDKTESKSTAKEAEKQERIEKARAKRAQEEANKQSAGEITDEDVPQRTVDKGWALAQATDDKKEVRVSDDSKADSSSDTTGKSKKSSWFNFSLIKREPSRFKPTINPDHPSSSPQSVDNAIKLRKAKQRYKQEMAHLRQSYEYRLGLVRQLKQELKSNFKSDQQQLHSSYQLQIHDREIGSSAEPSSESDSTRKPEVQDNKDDKAST
ncbi:uncharacterized protein Dwil_GK15523 [Drosophila willistoni]|uniref:Uncharacterized protein n=1 Tax=Drosophila willistoni TaxID=7260 RepID=B4MWR3_DROWI|nr:uncharacterized protein Dwil_GK15523 [Drosophila willistoni]